MLNSIFFANGPYLMHLALFCWQSLSDASGIISLQSGIPIIFPSTISFCCWALQMPTLDTPGFQIRMYRPQTFAMPISNNCSAECAPERGNEPPARGNALGNKGNITNSIHRQGQMPEASDKGSQPYRNAYGISSLAPQHINQTPPVFLPLQHLTKSNA